MKKFTSHIEIKYFQDFKDNFVNLFYSHIKKLIFNDSFIKTVTTKKENEKDKKSESSQVSGVDNSTTNLD
jgi:hypothetical protein